MVITIITGVSLVLYNLEDVKKLADWVGLKMAYMRSTGQSMITQ
jgi:hypothetical protein